MVFKSKTQGRQIIINMNTVINLLEFVTYCLQLKFLLVLLHMCS